MAGLMSSIHSTLSEYDCRSGDRLAVEPDTHTSLCRLGLHIRNGVFEISVASRKNQPVVHVLRRQLDDQRGNAHVHALCTQRSNEWPQLGQFMCIFFSL